MSALDFALGIVKNMDINEREQDLPKKVTSINERRNKSSLQLIRKEIGSQTTQILEKKASGRVIEARDIFKKRALGNLN